MFWSPFALVAALAHASAAYDGGTMRWWQADSDDLNETINILNSLTNA